MAICGAVTFTILLVSGNTISMSVRERIREVGILKTLGFTPGAILGIVLGESADNLYHRRRHRMFARGRDVLHGQPTARAAMFMPALQNSRRSRRLVGSDAWAWRC